MEEVIEVVNALTDGAGEAKLPPDAKVIAFHGKPDPHDIMDSYYRKYKKASWIKKYWCDLV